MNSYDLVYLLCGGFRTYTVYLLMKLFYTESWIDRKKEVLMYVVYCMITSMICLIFCVPVWNVVLALAALFCLTLCYESTIRKRLFVSSVIFLVLVTIETMIVVCLDTMKHFILQDTTLQWQSAVIIVALVLVVNCVAFFLYEQLDNAIRIKYEKVALEEQKHFYELQMHVTREHNEQIFGIYHDINNNLNVLQGLLNKDEVEKAKIYLQKLVQAPGLESETVCSGNLIFDSILNYKINLAKEKQIAVRTNVCIPKDIVFDSIMWVTILGNLLDNAIEAAEQKTVSPYIDIQINYNKNSVILILKNSYSGSVTEENGRFRTRKKNAEMHGTGLENVRRAIGEKGNLDITYTADEFCVVLTVVV